MWQYHVLEKAGNYPLLFLMHSPPFSPPSNSTLFWTQNINVYIPLSPLPSGFFYSSAHYLRHLISQFSSCRSLGQQLLWQSLSEHTFLSGTQSHSFLRHLQGPTFLVTALSSQMHHHLPLLSPNPNYTSQFLIISPQPHNLNVPAGFCCKCDRICVGKRKAMVVVRNKETGARYGWRSPEEQDYPGPSEPL